MLVLEKGKIARLAVELATLYALNLGILLIWPGDGGLSLSDIEDHIGLFILLYIVALLLFSLARRWIRFAR